jgi:hypothetical protein
VKALKRKSNRELRALGRQVLAAEQMPPADREQWIRQQAAFRHEAHPDKTTVDLAGRVARVVKLPVCEEFKDRLPSTGVASWRQFSERDLFFGPGLTTRKNAEYVVLGRRGRVAMRCSTTCPIKHGKCANDQHR